MVTNVSDFLHAKTSMITIAKDTGAFLAVPEYGDGPFGAVILGHERYGLVQHTLDLAAKFAAYGYIAIAPDMASHWDGDKEALNRGDARLTITDDQIKYYMSQALDHLQSMPEVDNSCIAAMGVCASGGYPLLLNSIRKEVKANIVVYGGQRTPPEIIEGVTAPIIGIWGEDDFVININEVRDFRSVLEDKRKTYEFTLFRGMPHGWMNTTMPARYRPKETDQAWALIIDFMQRAFEGEFEPGRVEWSFKSNIAPDYDFSKKVRYGVHGIEPLTV